MSHLTNLGLRVAFSIVVPLALGATTACGTDDGAVLADGSTRDRSADVGPDGGIDLGRETAPDVPLAPDTIDAPADVAVDLAEPVLIDAPVLGIDAPMLGVDGSSLGIDALLRRRGG
jgi:hypothetical protein